MIGLNLNIETLIIVLGVLVFLTNAIVEVIKKAFFVKGESTLNKIALATALVLTVCTYVVYVAYAGVSFAWHYFLAAIVVGFVVSLIAMVGWDKALKMWFESQKRS